MRIPSGTNRYIFFVAVDPADFTTRETGLSSFTVDYALDDGARAQMTTPTISQVDATNMPGVYRLLLDESGMTTLDSGKDTMELCVHIKQASMADVTRVIEIYRPETTEGTTLNVSSGNLNGISDGLITAAKLATDAITAAKIAADALGTSEFSAALIAAIADSIWDEARSGHGTQGTFGESFTALISGTVNTGITGASSTSFAAEDITEATEDHYVGRKIVFITGALAGQATNITAYTLTSGEGVFTVEALTEAPSDADEFIIF